MNKERLPKGLYRSDQDLCFADVRVADVVAGRTPCYVYSREAIIDRVNLVRSSLPGTAQIKFAVKANPHLGVIDTLAKHIDAFDVASCTELRKCGRYQKQISFSGPSKNIDELESALLAGATINLESVKEVEKLKRVSEPLGRLPSVAIRVNPQFSLSSTGLSMAGASSQFGIDSELVPSIMREIPDEWRWDGFHYFGGSQCLDASSLKRYYLAVVEDALKLSTSAKPLTKLNLGLSLGIPYTERDVGLPISALSETIHQCDEEIRHTYPQYQLQVESGRYLVGESGVFVTKVVDVKRSRGKNFVICDGGLNHFLAATGNLGQVIPRNYPLFTTPIRTEVVASQIVGPLCTPLDVLGRNLELPLPLEDDLVLVSQAGAYGASASPQEFLSRGSVTEIIL